MDIHWSIHKRWVKTLGNVIWLQTLEGTHKYGGGKWCQWPIDASRWIVNLKMNVTTHLTGSHGWQIQIDCRQGGSEMGKYTLCQVLRNENCYNNALSTSLMQNTPTHQKRDPYLPIQGSLYTLHWRWWKTKKPELTARAWGHAPQRKKGEGQPPSWIALEILPPQNTSNCNRQYSY